MSIYNNGVDYMLKNIINKFKKETNNECLNLEENTNKTLINLKLLNEYVNNKVFKNTTYVSSDIEKTTFENCVFLNCTFQNICLINSSFKNMLFVNCTLENYSINLHSDFLNSKCINTKVANSMLIANIFDQSLFVSCVFKDSKIEHCNISDDSDVEFINTKVISKSDTSKKENIVRVSKEFVYDSPPSILYTDSNVTYCIPEEYFTKINNYNYIIIPENEQFFEIKKKNRNNEVEVLNLNRSNFIQLANKVKDS